MLNLERALNRFNLNGFKNYADEDLIVVGTGDSSDTLFKSLFGLGPRGSYGKAVAQDGKFKEALCG